MPFDIQGPDATYLLRSLKQGEIVLVLGAGASRGSANRHGEPVKLGGELAKVIAEAAGFEYSGEALPEVLTAARPILGDRGLARIYTDEFADTTPGSDASSLSDYTWRRMYTWSIDDVLNNALTRKSQRSVYYNGMVDAASDPTGPAVLQVIKLHGDILHPEHGFIMSELDYNKAMARGSHSWYREISNDYLAYTPVFIGSRLSEPVLTAEIERAKRGDTEEAGRGYVITPDTLSDLQRSALRARGLVHISATLADFIGWLSLNVPTGLTPRDVLANTHSFSAEDLTQKITTSDLEAVSALFPRDMARIYSRACSAPASEISREARRFLRGFPATWDVAASDIPVWLSPTTALYDELAAAVADRQRMFVVTGQAGSGKSTAVMQALVKHGRTHTNVPIYELTGDVRSVRAAFNVVQKLHDGPAIVYISDLFVFGDQLAEDVTSFDRGRITVIATARTSEWNEHLDRRFGGVAIRHEYSRFTKSDYEPLIDRLLEYVPSPIFKSMNAQERVARLSKSREQLLIALREATYSQNFSDTITNEYESLPDEDTRALLMLVGIATAARVGIEVGSAKEAFGRLAKNRSFEEAERALDGIVSRLPNGRMFARHEIYVRHIIEDVVSADFLIECLLAITSTYTKYPVPVVRNINKIDATLFRFCWNHKFIYEQCNRRGTPSYGERLYSAFEIEFQLDGHFWLQYGLYLSLCGRRDDALIMLRRSIDAYPNNPFSLHAYAELQLEVARSRGSYDTVTRGLIDDAVKLLEELDNRRDELDQYPLVTLSNLHIDTLVRFDQRAAALDFGRSYFERLQLLEKRMPSERVTGAKERVFKLVTLGEWGHYRGEAVGRFAQSKKPSRPRHRRRDR